VLINTLCSPLTLYLQEREGDKARLQEINKQLEGEKGRLESEKARMAEILNQKGEEMAALVESRKLLESEVVKLKSSVDGLEVDRARLIEVNTRSQEEVSRQTAANTVLENERVSATEHCPLQISLLPFCAVACAVTCCRRHTRDMSWRTCMHARQFTHTHTNTHTHTQTQTHTHTNTNTHTSTQLNTTQHNSTQHTIL
jgi:hypothetical protein